MTEQDDRDQQQAADDLLLALATARFEYGSQMLDGFKWGLVTVCVIVPVAVIGMAVAQGLWP